MSHIQLNRQPPNRPRVLFGRSRYVPGKTPRFEGVYIGLLDEERMELLQNRKLKELTPEMQECLRRRGISFGRRLADPPGRRPSQDKPVRLGDLEGAAHEEVGIFRTLRHLASEAGLTQSLQDAFGASGDRLFALACHLTAGRGELYLAELWLEGTPFGKSGLSSASISRLLESIGKDAGARLDFHRSWYKACGSPGALVRHHRMSMSGDPAPETDAPEGGRGRGGESPARIHLASVHALQPRLPLFYRILPGAVCGTASLGEVDGCLERLGIHDRLHVLGKGCFSDGAVGDMLAAGIDFTIAAGWNPRLLKLLHRRAGGLHSAGAKSILPDGKRILWVRGEYPLEEDAPQAAGGKATAYVFHDPIAAERLMQELENEVEDIVQESRQERFATAKEARAWVAANHAGAAPCLVEVTEAARKRKNGGVADGLGVLLERSPLGIRRRGETFGSEAVVTSRADQDAADVFAQWHAPDPLGKTGGLLADALGRRRLPAEMDPRTEGRLFVAFLATIVHAMLENRLRERGLLRSVSVEEALALLAKVGRTRFKDGREIRHDVPGRTCGLIAGLGLRHIFGDYREFQDGKSPDAPQDDAPETRSG